MTDENLNIPAEQPEPVTPEPVTPAPETPAPVEETKERKSLSWWAVLSLLAGIGTYVWFFAMIGSKTVLSLATAPILALFAIITGHKSRADIKKSAGLLVGKKIANGGLALGYLYFIIAIFLIGLSVALGIGILKMFGL